MIIILILTAIILMISMWAGMTWYKAIPFSGFFITAILFLGAAFFDWLAKQHAADQRILPVCIGLAAGSISIGFLII